MSRRVGDLLSFARSELRKASFEPSPREALLLLSRAIQAPEAQLLAYPERLPTRVEEARFTDLLTRRLRGEPVAYLLNEKEFWRRPFFVDGRVLVPRPETEHLIETVLSLDLPSEPRVLDIGTGSGCIAVTLALEVQQARVVATDVSLAALQVARRNALRHGCEVRLIRCDLGGSLRLEEFDVIACNPPYIAEVDRDRLSPEILDFEPHGALFGGTSGLAAYEALLPQLASLSRNASIVLEIGAGQASAVISLAAASDLEMRQVVKDYAGHDRVVLLGRAPSPGSHLG